VDGLGQAEPAARGGGRERVADLGPDLDDVGQGGPPGFVSTALAAGRRPSVRGHAGSMGTEVGQQARFLASFNYVSIFALF
jgi:hypothetical protein